MAAELPEEIWDDLVMAAQGLDGAQDVGGREMGMPGGMIDLEFVDGDRDEEFDIADADIDRLNDQARRGDEGVENDSESEEEPVGSDDEDEDQPVSEAIF